MERCATWTKEPDVLTVLNFLKKDPLTKIKLEPDFEPAGIISFVVNNRVIIDNPAVQASGHPPMNLKTTDLRRCNAWYAATSGRVLDRLQTKVKGIPGGQSSGTNIISANEDPYPVLRTPCVADRSNLFQMRRRIHQRSQPPPVLREKQADIRQHGTHLLDKGGSGVRLSLCPR